MTSFYDGETVQPPTKSASDLADAFCALVDAKQALAAEKESVRERHRKMDYDPIGYTASDWEVEQEAYNRAVDRFEMVVLDTIAAKAQQDRRDRDRR